MRHQFLLGTAVLAFVAAIATGLIADKIIEDFEHASGGAMWSQVAFILLVPAALGAISLALPGRRNEWRAFVFVAGGASLGWHTPSALSSERSGSGRCDETGGASVVRRDVLRRRDVGPAVSGAWALRARTPDAGTRQPSCYN